MNTPLPSSAAAILAKASRRNPVLGASLDSTCGRITRLAARLLAAPVALIAFLDGDQAWYQSVYAPTPETDFPLHPSPILLDDVIVAGDVQRDPRFTDHPLVTAHPTIRFYAAAPIREPGGTQLGALSVMDVEPRDGLGENEVALLRELAALVGAAIESHLLAVKALDIETPRQKLGDRPTVFDRTAHHQPLETLLTELALLIERQCPELLCLLLVEEGGRLYPGAAPSLPQELVRAMNGLPVRVATWGGPIHPASDPAAAAGESAGHPLWAHSREIAAAHDFHPFWLFPLVSSSGETVGLFAVYSRECRSPDQRDAELLAMAGRLAVIAIEQSRLTDQLAYQAQHDALTGLPNRLLFEDRLRQALAHARRHQKMVALLFIDLDRFKQINDTLGHHVGDLLLKQAAHRLESCIRQYDTLARIGGDEFILVLPELADPEGAAGVARKLLNALNSGFKVAGRQLFVGASVGISLFPRDGEDPATLQRTADAALYRAKTLGRNAIAFFGPETRLEVRAWLELERDMLQAIERGELLLYYQPQVDVGGTMVGFEALLRWNHPRLGLIPPDKFVPLAESNGLIVQIGAWVLHQACRQLKAWRRAGFPALRVSVNVSAVQFEQPDFVETVIEALGQVGLEPDLLELELSESTLMRDDPEIGLKLARLRTLGVGIAIDNFGTEYSSFAYLQRLPIDTLKIDRSFLRAIGSSDRPPVREAAIIRAITMLAHNLGLSVVAEGVENERQLEFLSRVRYDGLQGYLFSAPLPADEFEGLLKRLAKLPDGGPNADPPSMQLSSAGAPRQE